MESEPCNVCGHDGDEADLLICDGCETCWHTYCVGLERVPSGNWFCPSCLDQQPVGLDVVDEPPSFRRRRQQPHGPVTLARRRRYNDNFSPWARVGQVVWDQLNIDLDFPSDEEESRALYRQTQRARRIPSNAGALRRDPQQWQHTLGASANQDSHPGGTGDTRPGLLNSRTNRRPAEEPAPETPEESRAWTALERVQQQEAAGSSGRKRKSRTASPSDDNRLEEPSERKFKRPRTRRAQDITAPANGTVNVSRVVQGSSRPTSNASSGQEGTDGSRSGGPSFLQSLLKEAETSIAIEATTLRMATAPVSNNDDRAFSQASRVSPPPAKSPTMSSSRSGSPSPSRSRSTTRPGSPLPLTSKVEPVFPTPRGGMPDRARSTLR